MTKFSDIIASATEKASAIQAQIDQLTADKAALDKLAGEAGHISSESLALFDQISESIANPAKET